MLSQRLPVVNHHLLDGEQGLFPHGRVLSLNQAHHQLLASVSLQNAEVKPVLRSGVGVEAAELAQVVAGD